MKSKAVIFALVTEAFGGRGGIAQYNRDFFSALSLSPAVSSIIVLPRHTQDAIGYLPNAIEQSHPKHGRFTYVAAALVIALFRSIDIVFCGHIHMAPLAAVVARLKGAKLIIQTHGIEAWTCPTWLRRNAVEAADNILCVSRYTRSRLLSWANVTPERALVLPNTVSTAFAPRPPSPGKFKWEFVGRRVLLTVGRLDRREQYKGHDRIIALIPSLVLEGHDVVYAVVGEGDDMTRLQELARKVGVLDRVRFMGAISNDVLPSVYNAADLFVMPSTKEGFGIVYLEAMASGTPALGLSTAGACDALADGELGTAVAEGDLAQAISKLLAMPKPDEAKLAEAVQTRFGHTTFSSCVYGLLQNIVVPT